MVVTRGFVLSEAGSSARGFVFDALRSAEAELDRDSRDDDEVMVTLGNWRLTCRGK